MNIFLAAISGLIGSFGGSTILARWLERWLGTRLEQSIKAEYDRGLERLRNGYARQLEELREEIGRRKVIRDEQFRIAQCVSLRVLQIRKQIQELRGGFKFGGAWGPWEQGQPQQLPAADAIPGEYKEASKKLDRSFGRLEHAMIKAEILFDVGTIRASRHRLMGLAQEFFGGISSFAYAKREHALSHLSDSEYQAESARLRQTLIVPLLPRDRDSFQERIDAEVSVIQSELRKYLSTDPPVGQLPA